MLEHVVILLFVFTSAKAYLVNDGVEIHGPRDEKTVRIGWLLHETYGDVYPHRIVKIVIDAPNSVPRTVGGMPVYPASEWKYEVYVDWVKMPCLPALTQNSDRYNCVWSEIHFPGNDLGRYKEARIQI